MFKYAIVDDIHSASLTVKCMGHFSEFTLTHIFSDPMEALTYIQEGKMLDLLFLDVEMPKITGIELVKLVRHKVRKIIFISSQTIHAIKAFNVNADGYLSKPFTMPQLKEKIEYHFSSLHTTIPMSYEIKPDFFFIKNKLDKLSMTKVTRKDIVAIESLHNYVKIYTKKEDIVSYFSLAEIKAILLGHSEFIQIHRCFIISTNYIDRINGFNVKMEGELQVKIGSAYATRFFEFIKSHSIGMKS